MMKELIEWIVQTIELLAVLIILGGIIYAVAGYFFGPTGQGGDTYKLFKSKVGKALLLGLEFLVAADIVSTVALTPTIQSVTVLAVLVFLRTFLSWSLVVEIEGRWPWQAKRDARQDDPLS
jgi:uncharacterized membrane protein